ncbi:MAG: glycosyltransferase [Pseudomonadota bacterium]
MPEPTVTILMSAYNSARTLSAAVDSILAQTYPHFRFVIFDDASTDESREILRGFEDDRLVLRLLEQNRGLTQNLAIGVSEANTSYIARMDADDIAMPTRIARQFEFLEQHDEIDVLGTNVVFFDDQGNETIGIQPENHEDIAILLFFGFTMLHPTIMMRRKALLDGGFNYNPRFKYSQDYDLWSRMAPTRTFANLQTPLLKLREHPGKITRSKRNEQQMFSAEIRARQLKTLLPMVSDQEIQCFVQAARGDPLAHLQALSDLDRLLERLIFANNARRIYNPDKFSAEAALFFKGICRSHLDLGMETWSIYSKSTLRTHLPDQSLRARWGFRIHSMLAKLRGVQTGEK